MAKQVQKRITIASSYKRAFQTEDGERVLRDLMKQYYILTPTYGGIIDPNTMLVREGQRSVVVAILRELSKDMKVIKDHMDRANREQQERVYDNGRDSTN